MSTRIVQLDSDTLQAILAAWKNSMPQMFDMERSGQAAQNALTDMDTHFYALPNGAFMLLRNAIPGRQAGLQFISLTKDTVPELEAARAQLRNAVQEYRLRRVDVIYPTSLEWRDFKLLGFKHEGRIRQSGLFDNEWVDVEILGALEHEVGVARRRRRKRYRPNMEKMNGTTPKYTKHPTDTSRPRGSRRPKGSSHLASSASRDASRTRPDK